MGARIASEYRPQIEGKLEPRQSCAGRRYLRYRRTVRARLCPAWNKKPRGIELVSQIHAHRPDGRAVAKPEADRVRQVVQIARRRRSQPQVDAADAGEDEIGRASCRERV